jgi:hypothetical protein
MSATIAKDREALPLFLNDPMTQDLAKIGLENPEQFSIALKERINSIIPKKVPRVPPFLLDHSK